MNSREADMRRGRGVRCHGFLLRSSLTLTMEPQSATPIALSICVSPPLSVSLSLSLSIPLILSLRSPTASLSCPAVEAEMHHRISAEAPPHPPPLPHVCSFSRQAGLKSQLRIEPSRLKPVSHIPSPPPTCDLLATVEKRMRSR